MALSFVDRGSGNHATSSASWTLSPASNCTAGKMIALWIAIDNAGASGAGFSTFTVTDGLGNTWTRRRSPLYDPGAASAGVEGALFTTSQNGGTLQTSTVITVTTNNAATSKAWTLTEVAGSVGAVSYVTGGDLAGAATGTPTITTGSIPSGDGVMGAGFAESGDTWAGDADATNGSWSTHQHNAAGTGATGMSITSQSKVVTATATQTYNPTLTSADCMLSWAQFHEAAVTSVSAPITVTLTPAVVKNYTKPVAITATFTLAVVKNLARTVAIAVTFTVAPLRRFNKVTAITVTFTVASVRLLQKGVTIGVTFTVVALRRLNRVVGITVTFTVASLRRIARTVAIGVTFTVAATRSVLHAVVVAISLVLGANVSRRINKGIAVAVAFVVTAIRDFVAGAPYAGPRIATDGQVTFDVQVGMQVIYAGTSPTDWNKITRELPAATSVDKIE
jgi:hypothetical protein